jgi:hypothetical protein
MKDEKVPKQIAAYFTALAVAHGTPHFSLS